MSSDALRGRATQLGIETSYWDVAGRAHAASDATLQAIVDVLDADAAGTSSTVPPVLIRPTDRVAVGPVSDVELALADGAAVAIEVVDGHAAVPPDLPIGSHQLRLSSGDIITLVVPPPAMPRAAVLACGASLFVPAYALWEESAPLPSFAHLAAFSAAAHRLGIDVVTTLPLYAAFLDEPFDPSPYAPVSRLHWNELYLDDATLPAAVVPPLQHVIEWRELAARRRRQLLAMVNDLDPHLEAGITRFLARRPDVAEYARFRAARPDAADAGAPAALVERSHILGQYLADHQLAAVEGEGRAALALDLPIGSHLDGYETARYGDLFATGMTVGAPPDDFFADGQDWGFPPQLPGAGRRSGHALWRRLVAHAGAHASLLRIDHVMGVHRLWWVPEGMGATEGAYVRYPREELLAVIAAEAARAGTTIVGENLGTVPDDVTAALERWDKLGMYEEQFHVHADGLPAVPARTVAGIRTHDMPAFATVVDEDPHRLAGYRHHLAAALGRPVGETASDLLDGALERLAASEAYLVVADMDDLLGETAPHNVPGRVLSTSWRRRMPRPSSAVLADLDVRRRVKLLANREAREAHQAGGIR